MTLTEFKNNWENTPYFHKATHDNFVQNTNADDFLNEHRTYIEQNILGFGERSFQFLWKLIVDEMPSDFSFIEIGVFKGQILSLIQVLASRTGRSVKRYGVTPLDTSGDMWESDYEADIARLHDYFFIPKDYTLYVGSSHDPVIIEKAYQTSPYDILYVDGDHSYEGALADLNYYAPFVKRGGFLVIDDCNNDLNFPSSGFFCGIQPVTDAKIKWLEQNGDDWEFYGNVVHISVYKRK